MWRRDQIFKSLEVGVQSKSDDYFHMVEGEAAVFSTFPKDSKLLHPKYFPPTTLG